MGKRPNEKAVMSSGSFFIQEGRDDCRTSLNQSQPTAQKLSGGDELTYYKYGTDQQ